MSKTILVVEDNEMNLRLMTDLLGYYGYRVLEAGNGAQALIMADQHHIDLIVMDMQMPIMSGYEAVKKLRSDKKNSEIKIIAVTSFALTDERERILDTGVDEFISKPIDTREFPKIIAMLIARESTRTGRLG